MFSKYISNDGIKYKILITESRGIWTLGMSSLETSTCANCTIRLLAINYKFQLNRNIVNNNIVFV